MNNAQKFYLFNGDIPKEILRVDPKTREFGLWFKGDTNDLLKFYKSKTIKEQFFTPNFYKLAPYGTSSSNGAYAEMNGFTVLHSSMASNISKVMADLVFSTAPKIKINSGNKVHDKELNKQLDDIIEDNKMNSLLRNSAEEVSAYGEGVFTITLDPDISDHPIVQFFNKEEFYVNKKYGRVVSVITRSFYKKENEEYCLLTEIGWGTINYRLLNVKLITEKDGYSIVKEVPLNTIAETSQLKNIKFVDESGKPFNHLLAVFVENREGGKSDYYNVIDDFMTLDENYSNMNNFIRKRKPKLSITENNLKKTENGDPIIPSVYDTEFTVLWDSNPIDTPAVPDQPDFNLQASIAGYVDSINTVRLMIANSVGLSPASLGIDSAGANASGEALNIRENNSARTRDEKLVKWKDSLVELVKLLISTDMPSEMINGIIKVRDLYDYEVSIEFADYQKKTFAEIIEENTALSDLGVIDTQTLIQRIFVDTGIYTQEKADEIFEKIKGEDEDANKKMIDRMKAELSESDTSNNEEDNG